MSFDEVPEEELDMESEEGRLLQEDDEEDDAFENDGEVYLIDHEEALLTIAPTQVLPVSAEEDISTQVPSENAPKVRKKRPPSEAKLTKDLRKRIFSSLTARRSPVTFFGIGDQKKTLVMANTEGGLLTEYRCPRLGFHIVQFKKDEDWNRVLKLREDLKLTDPRRVYITNVTRYLACCNKVKSENVRVWEPDTKTVCCAPEVLTKYKKENVVAVTLANFYIADVVRALYKEVTAIAQTADDDTRPHQWLSLNKDPLMNSILSFVRLDTHQFTDKNGTSLFEDRQRYLQVPLFDGIGTPSTKEFVRKQEESSLYRMYAWVEENSYIRTMTVFEDDAVQVISLCPNLCYRPRKSTTA